jgi:hypothetical protein
MKRESSSLVDTKTTESTKGLNPEEKFLVKMGHQSLDFLQVVAPALILSKFPL